MYKKVNAIPYPRNAAFNKFIKIRKSVDWYDTDKSRNFLTWYKIQMLFRNDIETLCLNAETCYYVRLKVLNTNIQNYWIFCQYIFIRWELIIF